MVEIIKNENKIRKLLGNDYCLETRAVFPIQKERRGRWALYSDKDIYLERPIMTSETNTEKELLKFAKKHHEYDITLFHSKLRVAVAIVMMIATWANIFINSSTIRIVTLSVDAYLIFECLLSGLVDNHNFKAKCLKFIEEVKYLRRGE
jgi:hypothetical protein